MSGVLGMLVNGLSAAKYAIARHPQGTWCADAGIACQRCLQAASERQGLHSGHCGLWPALEQGAKVVIDPVQSQWHSALHSRGKADCGEKTGCLQAMHVQLMPMGELVLHLLSIPPPPDCFANSAMSKPALNLPLDPVTTMALTSFRACASRRQLKRALSTASSER